MVERQPLLNSNSHQSPSSYTTKAKTNRSEHKEFIRKSQFVPIFVNLKYFLLCFDESFELFCNSRDDH